MPCGPVAILFGSLPLVGTLNSAPRKPLVVIRPILLAVYSVNHRVPSGPAAISIGWLLAVEMGNSSLALMVPAVVIRPILLAPNSVNQILPSGPAVIPFGLLSAVGTV